MGFKMLIFISRMPGGMHLCLPEPPGLGQAAGQNGTFLLRVETLP